MTYLVYNKWSDSEDCLGATLTRTSRRKDCKNKNLLLGLLWVKTVAGTKIQRR